MQSHRHGTVWHTAGPDLLAPAVARLATELRARFGLAELVRFAVGSGFHVESKQTSDDLSAGALREHLAHETHVVLLVGGPGKEPDLQILVNLPSWMREGPGEVRYEPPLRESIWTTLGGVVFSASTARWGPDEQRALFRLVVRSLPAVCYAVLDDRAVVLPEDPETLRPPGFVEAPWSRLGELQWFGGEGIGAAAAGELKAALAGQDGLEVDVSGVWLAVPGGGRFDPASPVHRAWLARVGPKLRRIGLGVGRDEELVVGSEESRREWQRRAAELVGQRVVGARYLQHLRDGAEVDPGWGPVELELDSGRRVHFWPVGNDMGCCEGVLDDRQARWRHPTGAVDSLELRRLKWVPSEGRLARVIVEMGGFCGVEMSVRAWTLEWEDGTVLSLWNERPGRSARIEWGPVHWSFVSPSWEARREELG